MCFQVILKNLEEQGIIKGGSVAVHMNRNRIRSRSRSPIKLHTNFEYVPSPKHKQRVGIEDFSEFSVTSCSLLSYC